MHHLTRTLALVAIVVAAVLGAGGTVVLAQSAQRTIGGPRSTTVSAPTPPPLPFGDQSRPQQGAKRSMNAAGTDALTAFARLPASARMGVSPLRAYTGPRPPIPKMSDLLHHRARWKQSASGGRRCIARGPAATVSAAFRRSRAAGRRTSRPICSPAAWSAARAAPPSPR